MDTKYSINIKNCEKPKAETNETPPEPELTYAAFYDYRHRGPKDDA